MKASSYWNTSYLLYLCPCVQLGLFILYLCDLFFIFIFIFIMINRIILWIQTHLFFCLSFIICPYYLGLWRAWGMRIIFKCQKSSLKVLLSICLIFCQFQLAIAYKSAGYKKASSSWRFSQKPWGRLKILKPFQSFNFLLLWQEPCLNS